MLAIALGDARGASVGWRGDGSGRYPDVDPPLHWGRASKEVQELRCQAAKPKEGDTGTPMQLGVIADWLVLGPLALPAEYPRSLDPKTFKDPVVPDVGALSPDEGDELAGAKWRRIAVASSIVHWTEIFGRDSARTNPPAYALAHAYVYSPTGGLVTVQCMHRGVERGLINGREFYTSGGHFCSRLQVRLLKGWNRVVLKLVSSGASEHARGENWYSRLSFYGTPSSEYETRNIAWSAAVPGGGAISSPIIVGDRIFVTGGWCSLCCFNKADGKLLWVRSCTSYEAATDEERKAHADVVQEIEPLAAKLRQVDESLSTPTPLPDDRIELQKSIHKLMLGMDMKRYALPRPGEPGYSAPTPASDGRQVYVAYTTGATAAYDLEGNRKWANFTPYPSNEHGSSGSPWVVGDRLIVSKFCFEAIAYDTQTGKELWHNPSTNRANTSIANNSSVMTVNVGGEALLVEPYACLSRVSDGKCLFPGYLPQNCIFLAIPTPVIDKNTLFLLDCYTDRPLQVYRLPATVSEPFKPEPVKTVKVGTWAYPRFYEAWHNASPLYDEGLLYAVNDDGVLTVVDAEQGEVVYRKLLDADLHIYHNFEAGRGGMGSSPTLAGKYIYLFGNQGTCLVIEPGRTFKQVAKNRMERIVGTGHWWERNEIMESCPVFEGRRLYYRGETHLYCIEEKKQ